MRQAAIENGLSQSSLIKYTIDHGRPCVKRRSDKKNFFFIREIRFNETLSVNQTSALFIETRQMKKVQKNKSR